jgi:hypothetical protein
MGSGIWKGMRTSVLIDQLLYLGVHFIALRYNQTNSEVVVHGAGVCQCVTNTTQCQMRCLFYLTTNILK